jgi:hypothetical protein
MLNVEYGRVKGWSLGDEKLDTFLYDELKLDKPVTLSPSL